MRHLSIDQFLDIADGTLPEAAVPHLASCERCQHELTELRATLSAASAVNVPEPSPLFWDHLSTRVHDAVAQETVGPGGGWIDGWFSWRLVAPAVAAVVVLVTAITFRPGGPHVTSSSSTLTTATARASIDEAVPAVDASDAVEPGEKDASLSLLADLAGDFEWDDAMEAGLAAGSGAVDRAMMDLTPDQFKELQRLLKEEMSRSGA